MTGRERGGTVQPVSLSFHKCHYTLTCETPAREPSAESATKHDSEAFCPKLLMLKMLEQIDRVGPCNVIDDLPFTNIAFHTETVTFQVSKLLPVLFKSYLNHLFEEK